MRNKQKRASFGRSAATAQLHPPGVPDRIPEHPSPQHLLNPATTPECLSIMCTPTSSLTTDDLSALNMMQSIPPSTSVTRCCP